MLGKFTFLSVDESKFILVSDIAHRRHWQEVLFELWVLIKVPEKVSLGEGDLHVSVFKFDWVSIGVFFICFE